MDSLRHDISEKFRVNNLIIECLKKEPQFKDKVCNLQKSLSEAKKQYTLHIGPIFVIANGEKSRSSRVEDMFVNEINKLNTFGILDNVHKELKEFSNNIKPRKSQNVKNINNLICVYPNTKTPKQKKIDNICQLCGGELVTQHLHGFIKCQGCGLIQEIAASQLDTDFYGQEIQTKSKGTFSSDKHYSEHLVCLTGRSPDSVFEKKQPAKELFENINKVITDNGYLLRMMTIQDMRVVLKKIKRTDLNDHIPTLLKKVTGIGPPTLDSNILTHLEEMFSIVINVIHTIPNIEGTNLKYYPYYTYKFLDQILPLEDYATRRILCYIHLQKKETIEKNDKTFEKICQRVPQFKYKPTDRTAANKYWGYVT